MNILVYFENPISPTIGGTERAAANLIDELRNLGHSVFTMSKYSPIALGISFPNAYIKHTVNILPNENLLHEDNIKYITDFLRDKAIDIIINEGGNTNDVQLFNHKVLSTKARIITCLHFCTLQGFGDYYYSDIPLIKTYKDVFRIIKMPYTRKKILSIFKENYLTALKYCDAFVVLDNVFKTELSNFLNTKVFDDKIYVIPNMNSYENVEKNPMSEKENRILYVGRLQYKTKRVDRLLKACKILGKQLEKWQVDIVGDGPDRYYYEKMAAKLQLSNVKFYGKQQPEEFYKKAKIIALTSTHESFGMTLIEGMSFGCIPIAFDSYSSVKSLIKNGKNGLLVKPFSINSYADKLLQIMSNTSLQDEMVKQSDEILMSFSREKVSKHWEELINKIVI